MNAYLFHPEVYAVRYNCSAFSREEWFKFGTPNPLVGGAVVVLGVFLEMLYLPFILTMLQPKFLENSCYKLMLVLGIQDAASIYDGGIVTGYLTMQGAVFCTHERLIYFSGMVGIALWFTASTTCMLLTLNRLIDIYYPHLSYTLFNGWRTWLWALIPVIVFILVIFTQPPLIFNSSYMSWFFFPYYGMNLDFDPDYYRSVPHIVNNITVIIVLCSGNLLLYRHVLKTAKTGCVSQSAKTQRKLLMQIGIVCLLNVMCSSIYVFMQFVASPPWLTLLGSMTYTLNTGALAVTYVLLNKTLRRAAAAMFVPKELLSKIHKASSRGVSDHHPVSVSIKKTVVATIT